MTKDEISVYTRRITQGNRSDIIVVLFDIYMDYSKAAREAFCNKDEEALSSAVKHCNEVVSHLAGDLDFAYDISADLYRLYNYVQRTLAKFSYKRQKKLLEEAENIMKQLREAFIEVAACDNSGRQMQNAQTVIAGMTYQRGTLYEMTDFDCRRGYYA